MSFVTVRVVDNEGVLVPNADNLVNFNIKGPAKIVGVDNGLQTSHESFKASYRKAFNGLCLVVLQSIGQKGTIVLEATSDDLVGKQLSILTN